MGAYSVTAFFAGSTDYASTVATACFSITPAPLTITANDQDKTYGQTVTFAGTEFSAAGLVNGDSISSVSLSSTGAAATASVGSYAIEASNAMGSGLNNYAISYVSGTLEVTPASLTITASAVSGVYGKVRLNDSTGFSAVGLQNGETIGSVSLSSDATLSSLNDFNVGAWTITPSAAGGGTFTASNYAIDGRPGDAPSGRRAKPANDLRQRSGANNSSLRTPAQCSTRSSGGRSFGGGGGTRKSMFAPFPALNRDASFQVHLLAVWPLPVGGDNERVGTPRRQTRGHEFAARPVLPGLLAIDPDDGVGGHTNAQQHIGVSEPKGPCGTELPVWLKAPGAPGTPGIPGPAGFWPGTGPPGGQAPAGGPLPAGT